jgi:hypothetical protein
MDRRKLPESEGRKTDLQIPACFVMSIFRKQTREAGPKPDWGLSAETGQG